MVNCPTSKLKLLHSRCRVVESTKLYNYFLFRVIIRVRVRVRRVRVRVRVRVRDKGK